jgi:tRNA U34 5-methylaminomethyl-2-thiouridine-forming methyltransferase MnmC
MQESAHAIEMKITEDGSHTLFVPSLGEHYHSTYGAINESRHVFLGAGFHAVAEPGKHIRIFEVGFGTGLNALLTLFECQKMGCNVEYFTIERHPLPVEVIMGLNYPALLDFPEAQDYFLRMHQASWYRKTRLTEFFAIEKIYADLHEYPQPEFELDLVFFDAFGPDVQPDLWTEEVFSMIGKAMRPGGILVTYSTKGLVKRNLQSAGFSIEKLPGPKGKREILRATRGNEREGRSP